MNGNNSDDNSGNTADNAPGGALFDVLVHGMIGADYLLQLDGIPPAGEVRVIEREVRGVGGEAANCALALAMWGARVCLTGNPLGDDSNGRLAAGQLAAQSNLTLHLPRLQDQDQDYETPYSVVLAAWRAPRVVLVRHQAAQRYDQNSGADAPAGAWPASRLATCDGNLVSATYRMARRLKERGTPLFAQDALLNESLAPLAEVVLLTDAFWPRANEKQLLRTACERANEWGNTVVITRGAQGGVWCHAGQNAQRYAPAAMGDEDVLGSVGAGDVFRAGLLWARLQGWEWERGLRFAAVAAALKCRLAGVMPQLGQIEAVL